MVSTYTPNLNLEKPAAGDYPNAWAGPLNAIFDILDKKLAQTQNYTLGASDVTATQTELQNLRVKVSGTLTANVAVKIPNGLAGIWIFDNRTTGSFTLTVKQATGDAGVTVAQNKRSIVISDGTNCIYGNDVIDSATVASQLGLKALAYKDTAAYADVATAAIATAAELIQGAASKLLSAAAVASAATPTAGGNASGPVTINLTNNLNIAYTLTGNTTFSVTGARPGWSGIIELAYGGAFTPSWTAGQFVFANSLQPQWSAASGKTDVLGWYVMSTGKVLITMQRSVG